MADENKGRTVARQAPAVETQGGARVRLKRSIGGATFTQAIPAGHGAFVYPFEAIRDFQAGRF